MMFDYQRIYYVFTVASFWLEMEIIQYVSEPLLNELIKLKQKWAFKLILNIEKNDKEA